MRRLAARATYRTNHPHNYGWSDQGRNKLLVHTSYNENERYTGIRAAAMLAVTPWGFRRHTQDALLKVEKIAAARVATSLWYR